MPHQDPPAGPFFFAGKLAPRPFPMLALPFSDGIPSDGELRIAQAQLVGWLEGLFHGIQATLFAQQMAARQQFEQLRQINPGGPNQQPGSDSNSGGLPGTYL